jgi:environmental stress-induced protein Ves
VSARLVRLDDVAAQPWKNGGGATRELLAWPSAADWRVRVSVADIDRDGPFSAFPGVERWFAVLQGQGVDLDLGGATRRAVRGDAPLRFDGAAAQACRLVDGPTRDLNLMLRGARGRLENVAPGRPWQVRDAMAGLFAREAGRCEADGAARDVPAFALLWFDAAPAAMSFGAPGFWIGASPAEAQA